MRIHFLIPVTDEELNALGKVVVRIFLAPIAAFVLMLILLGVYQCGRRAVTEVREGSTFDGDGTPARSWKFDRPIPWNLELHRQTCPTASSIKSRNTERQQE